MSVYDSDFLHLLAQAHQATARTLPAAGFCQLADQLLDLLFPERATRPLRDADAIAATLRLLQDDLAGLLRAVVSAEKAVQLAVSSVEALPALRATLLLDAAAIVAADPAAQGLAEVVSTYPGFYAIALHRFAHGLHQQGVPRVPRLLSEYAHQRTGVDIHPGATIGPSFCIDHGTGLVIGETCRYRGGGQDISGRYARGAERGQALAGHQAPPYHRGPRSHLRRGDYIRGKHHHRAPQHHWRQCLAHGQRTIALPRLPPGPDSRYPLPGSGRGHHVFYMRRLDRTVQ